MKETLSRRPETNFSEELRIKLADRLAKDEQSVLMLNRRGFSSFVMCRDCGYVPCDPNCNLAMTLHMDTHTLKCHYCGHEEKYPLSVRNVVLNVYVIMGLVQKRLKLSYKNYFLMRG